MIKNDVTQGSILGPQFCILYINDRPKIITKNNSMFFSAHDTSLPVSINDFNININQSLSKKISWFNGNLLSLNF
jgi:hypothetical protein